MKIITPVAYICSKSFQNSVMLAYVNSVGHASILKGLNVLTS